jgi:hypothetical protein
MPRGSAIRFSASRQFEFLADDEGVVYTEFRRSGLEMERQDYGDGYNGHVHAELQPREESWIAVNKFILEWEVVTHFARWLHGLVHRKIRCQIARRRAWGARGRRYGQSHWLWDGLG